MNISMPDDPSKKTDSPVISHYFKKNNISF